MPVAISRCSASLQSPLQQHVALSVCIVTSIALAVSRGCVGVQCWCAMLVCNVGHCASRHRCATCAMLVALQVSQRVTLDYTYSLHCQLSISGGSSLPSVLRQRARLARISVLKVSVLLRIPTALQVFPYILL